MAQAAARTTLTSEGRRIGEREIRLRRLGRQIALARAGISQADLGERLGEFLDRDIPQTTISRWEKGQVDLGVEQIRALEIVLEMDPRGSLLAASGYVEFSEVPAQDLEAIIMTDPSLHPSQRSAVLNIYRTFVETSARLFEREGRDS